MSGPFTGMDVTQVRHLAMQMRYKAEEIRSIGQQLTAQLNGTPWVGADRDRYVSDWNGRDLAALHRVATALDEAASIAMRNADEQEQISLA